MIVMAKQEDPEANASGSSWAETVKIRDYWEWSYLGLCKIPAIAKTTFTYGTVPQQKAVCEMCPVKEDCLYWAIMYKESGVWGATTEEERNKKYSKDFRNALIEAAKKQKNYYSRKTPGVLIREYSKRQGGQ